MWKSYNDMYKYDMSADDLSFDYECVPKLETLCLIFDKQQE